MLWRNYRGTDCKMKNTLIVGIVGTAVGVLVGEFLFWVAHGEFHHSLQHAAFLAVGAIFGLMYATGFFED